MKLYPALFIFFGFSYCWVQNTTCRSKKLNDTQIEYQYQGRQISFNGWTNIL